MKTLSQLILIVVAACFTTSCYFNSAGYFMQKADYKAVSVSLSAKQGDNVLTDGSRYYIHLDRYRWGKERRITLSKFNQNQKPREDGMHPTGEKDLFEIPADFAMYLTGQATSPNTPSFMNRIKEPEKVLSRATGKLPIVARPGLHIEVFDYTSPNAFWWYTAGVFDWLCVDLPVTCAQNAIIGGMFIAAAAADAENNRNNISTYSSGSSSSSSDDWKGAYKDLPPHLTAGITH